MFNSLRHWLIGKLWDSSFFQAEKEKLLLEFLQWEYRGGYFLAKHLRNSQPVWIIEAQYLHEEVEDFFEESRELKPFELQQDQDIPF